jgi:alpha-N-arabinofuranosidase
VANAQGLRADGFADIKFADAGTYYLDFISLYPQDTYNNRENGLRTDLVQILKDMNPGFLRFPGGCVAEGVGPPNRYNWKKTVGPIEERQLDFDLWNENLYSGGQNNVYYYQSFGLGYYEYMLLCEDLEAEAMPVLNAGIACELRETGTYGNSIYAGGVSTTEVDMEGLQPFIDDAIDFIAFCNEDPADNKWAALRAEMGHPEPFNLEMVAIGNEQQNGGHYLRYFDEFEKQIHAIYPEIKLIHSSGRSTSGTAYNTAWSWLLNGSDYSPGAKGLDYAYAVDEHGYYSNEATMYRDADRYNPTVANYVRGNRPYAFFGEYAFRNTQRINNTRSALVEAALMTGFERNADVVAMASYAPLFAKEDFAQWTPDAIWFSEYTVYGSAAYYNQKMYGANMGDYQIPNEISFTPATALPAGDSATKPYSSATFDEEANEIIIRAINPINYEMDAKFVLNGVDYVNPTGRVIQMGGDTNAAGTAINTVSNTITDQRNIYDREFSFDGFAKEFYYTLKPYSSTVMRISLNDNAHMVSYVPPVSLAGTAGTVSDLPARVDVVYADGHKGTESVTWEYKPDSFYDRAGDYRIQGDVANTKYDATLLLTLEESGPAFITTVTGNTLEKQGDSLVGNLTASVKNQQGVTAYASVILALYDDRGKLIFHDAKNDVILNLGDTELRFDGITVPDTTLYNYFAKIFVWEKDTFIPLCESEDFLAIQKTAEEKYPGVNTTLAAQPTLSTAKAYYPQHDGEIVYGPDTKGEYWYWDFSTDQGQYNGNEIRKSKDMVNWVWVGTAIRVYQDEETGKYFHNYPPGVTLENFNEDTGTYTRRVFSQGTNFWAPYVFDNSAVDGYYYMYYCFSQFATRTSDLGVYRSKALDGVWEYCSTLVQTRSAEGPGFNAIDPMVVRDKDGRLWLTYGSFFYGVAMVELDRNDPTKIIGEETYTLARRDQYDYTNDDGNNCGLEGSTIVYNPEFDYYYLSVSYDYLGNLYNTRIARSKNITGPYLDANGNDMNYSDAWDSPTRGDVGTKIVAPYAYNNDYHRGWVGTGHASFFKGQDGQYYLTHNSRPGTNSNRPYINVRRVIWTEDGWPLPSSEVTAFESAEDVSFVSKKAVAGEWEFIRLERIVPGRTLNQFTSVKYNFGSDGRVGSEGTWKYSAPGKDGNGKLTVNLGSTGEIEGKVYYGWDWENWKETVLFVGKDSNNTVYWGKLV